MTIWDRLIRQWVEVDEIEDVEDVLEGIKLRPVESSNLAAIGYNARRRELVIAFLDGSIYRYYGVPREDYTELMNADSHGEFFVANIRLAYDYERIAG